MANNSGKQLHTIIGSGAIIEGTIQLDHSIRIDGTVKGKVVCTGEIEVGSGGVVEADVEVKSACIGGRVVGNMVAKERIELESKALLMGDIKTKDLVINEGAVFQGNCAMENMKK
jgi:cytoskeletal protein CcmA (bactofilin family)